MIQHTANKPVSELFSSDNQVSYYIPKYQREYIWKKENWESLFDDIDEGFGGHFLGSIICINTETDSLRAPNLELVDGQQRMTTISLFYLAIYKYLSANLPVENKDAEYKLYGLMNKIVLENKKPRVTPSYTSNNLDDYSWIYYDVFRDGVNKPIDKPKFLGLRRMYKAFDYFCDRLNEIGENDNPIYDFEKVEELLKKLNSATIVKIDVSSHSDAFTLFETLNNRGVPLSAVDLIKNKLLGRLEKLDNQSIDQNFDRWSKVVSNLTDDYSTQERFLRQFYNAFKVDSDIEVKRAPKAIKSNLIKIYEELIDRNAIGILERLEEASEIYNNNIEYDQSENSKELIFALRNLENVNGADAYMLLMFLDKRFNIADKQKIELVNLLCKYFIRRNVTDTPNTRNLSNYFIDIIGEINELSVYEYNQVKEIILRIGRPADDELFSRKLQGNVYEENVGAVRYVLSSIELNRSQTDEIYTNFYERNKKLFIWTVEHIFPQGENIPSSWVEMIAGGDKVEAESIRSEYVHTIGNLTLTGHNSQLSNMPFEKKQNREKDGKYIGFKNGIWLNDSLKDAIGWTKEDIVNRTALLSKEAVDIFSLD